MTPDDADRELVREQLVLACRRVEKMLEASEGDIPGPVMVSAMIWTIARWAVDNVPDAKELKAVRHAFSRQLAVAMAEELELDKKERPDA